jgi:hypothetical protein
MFGTVRLQSVYASITYMRPIYINYFDSQIGFYDENTSTLSYQMLEYLFIMKTLPFLRDEKKNRVTVTCADGEISVYSHCAYCRHCKGVWVGKRLAPSPQAQALSDLRKGTAGDDTLMNAAMMFNTLVRDGLSLECDDDENQGFLRR